ncbi:MAG: hypothetical protein S4CHLAM20_04960 [Chlamydiia bacterium]|nr:hypothetical protein [Chlamydiia bacterium]
MAEVTFSGAFCSATHQSNQAGNDLSHRGTVHKLTDFDGFSFKETSSKTTFAAQATFNTSIQQQRKRKQTSTKSLNFQPTTSTTSSVEEAALHVTKQHQEKRLKSEENPYSTEGLTNREDALITLLGSEYLSKINWANIKNADEKKFLLALLSEYKKQKLSIDITRQSFKSLGQFRHFNSETLKQITYLNLRDLGLTSLPVETMVQLINLEVLDLGSNQLSNYPPSLRALARHNTKKLKLIISNNPMSSITHDDTRLITELTDKGWTITVIKKKLR